ncbi:hypothetical protein FTX45_19045 [Leclercia adecarboxylata]|nr:hypothetical protein FTX45_19045 [Leclercia adecarboxylata]
MNAVISGKIILRREISTYLKQMLQGPFSPHSGHAPPGIYHKSSLRAQLRRPESVSDGNRVKQATTPQQTRQKRRR